MRTSGPFGVFDWEGLAVAMLCTTGVDSIGEGKPLRCQGGKGRIEQTFLIFECPMLRRSMSESGSGLPGSSSKLVCGKEVVGLGEVDKVFGYNRR